MDLILEYQSQLIAGTLMTIKLALASLAIALVFGLTIVKVTSQGMQFPEELNQSGGGN